MKGRGHLIERLTFEIETDKSEKEADTFNLIRTLFYTRLEKYLEDLLNEYDLDGVHQIDKIEIDIGHLDLNSPLSFSDAETSTILRRIKSEFSLKVSKEIGSIKKDFVFLDIFIEILKSGYSRQSYLLSDVDLSSYFSQINESEFKRLMSFIKANRSNTVVSKRILNYLSPDQFSRIRSELFPHQSEIISKVKSLFQNLTFENNKYDSIKLEQELNLLLLTLGLPNDIAEEDLINALVINSSILSSIVQKSFGSKLQLTSNNKALYNILKPTGFSSNQFDSRIKDVKDQHFFKSLEYFVNTGSFNRSWYGISNLEYRLLLNRFIKNNSFVFREYLRKLGSDEYLRLISLSVINGNIGFLSHLVPNYHFKKKGFLRSIKKLESKGFISFEEDYAFSFDRLVLNEFSKSRSINVTVDKDFVGKFFRSVSYTSSLNRVNDLKSDNYIEIILDVLDEQDVKTNLNQVDEKHLTIDFNLDFLKNVLSYFLSNNKFPWWSDHQLKNYALAKDQSFEANPLSFNLFLWKELRRVSKSEFDFFVTRVLKNKDMCEAVFLSNNSELKHFLLDHVFLSFFNTSLSAFLEEISNLLILELPFEFDKKSLINKVCSVTIPLLLRASDRTSKKTFTTFIQAFGYALKIPYKLIVELIGNDQTQLKSQLGLSHDAYDILLDAISVESVEQSDLIETIITPLTIPALVESIVSRNEYIDCLTGFVETGVFPVYSKIEYEDFKDFILDLRKTNSKESNLLNLLNRSDQIQALLNSIDFKNKEDSVYKSLFLKQIKDLNNLSIDSAIDGFIVELNDLLNIDPVGNKISETFISKFIKFKKENIDNQNLLNQQNQKKRIFLFKEILRLLISSNKQNIESSILNFDVESAKIEDIQERITARQSRWEDMEKLNNELLRKEMNFNSLQDIMKIYQEIPADDLSKDEISVVIVKELIDLTMEAKPNDALNDGLLEAVIRQIEVIDQELIQDDLGKLKESNDVLISTLEYFLHFAKLPWWAPFESNQEFIYYFNKIYRKNRYHFIERLKNIIDHPTLKITLKNYKFKNDNNSIDQKAESLEIYFRDLIGVELTGLPSKMKLKKINWLIDNLFKIYKYDLNREFLKSINTAILQFCRVEFNIELTTISEYYRAYYKNEKLQSLNDFKMLTEESISAIESTSMFDSEKQIVIKGRVFDFVNVISFGDPKSLEPIIDNILFLTPKYVKFNEEPAFLINGVCYFLSLQEKKSYSDYLLSLRRNKSLQDSQFYDQILESSKSESVTKSTHEHFDFFLMIELLSLLSDGVVSSELFNLKTIMPYANTLISIKENKWGKSLLFLLLEAKMLETKDTFIQTVDKFNVELQKKGATLFPQLRVVLNDIYSGDIYPINPYSNVFNRLLNTNDEPFVPDSDGKLVKNLLNNLENDITFLDDYSEALQINVALNEESVIFENNKSIEWSNIEKGEQIYVPNAGIVLLWPFLTSLFRNLGYLDGKEFKDRICQERAVHLIQYIVDGEDTAPEFILMLNKIICGIELTDSIELNIRLTTKEKDEVNSFITSVKNQWKEMKNTSIEVFRDTFLKRDGALMYKNNNWNLKVEHKAIDILLTKLPWGLSMVKYSWNEYLIIVEWDAKN